jgi:hypothetical protein
MHETPEKSQLNYKKQLSIIFKLDKHLIVDVIIGLFLIISHCSGLPLSPHLLYFKGLEE